MQGSESILTFGEFELDFERRELRRDGKPVELQPTPLRLLLYLAEHRDQAVPTRELLDTLWPDATVTDTSIARALNQARHAVGDDGTTQRVIRTQKGHGYRFIAPIEVMQEPLAAAPVAEEILRQVAQTPFVGRAATLTRLTTALDAMGEK